MFNTFTRQVHRNGLTFQVPTSVFSRFRYTVHPDGTGTSWDESSPDVDQPHGLDYRSHQDMRKAVRIRLQKEHKTPATGSAGGEHLPGGCRILGIVDSTADLTKGAGDASYDITDGKFQGRGIIFDQTKQVLWCFTGDGTVSDDPYRLPIDPDEQYSGGDITWAGAHEFDGTVDFTSHVNVDGTLQADSLVIDGTETTFGGSAGTALFFDPTSYAGTESVTFPNGMILKMGSAVFNGINDYDVSFGTAFPTGIVSVTMTTVWDNNSNPSEIQIRSRGVTGFTYRSNQAISAGILWMAVGY